MILILEKVFINNFLVPAAPTGPLIVCKEKRALILNIFLHSICFRYTCNIEKNLRCSVKRLPEPVTYPPAQLRYASSKYYIEGRRPVQHSQTKL